MRNPIYFVLALFIISITMPSVIYSQDENITKEELRDLTKSRITTKSASKTIGSAFLIDDFQKGKMMLSDGKETAIIYIRFDMEKNNVQFLKNDEIYATDNSRLNGFEIFTDNASILFKNGFKTDKKNIDPTTLLRIAYDGKTKLVVRHKAILREDLATYGSATKQNKYDIYVNYFIVTEDGKFHEIEAAEEDIINILSDKKDQLQGYVNSENLNFEEESGLRSILKYYDSL